MDGEQATRTRANAGEFERGQELNRRDQPAQADRSDESDQRARSLSEGRPLGDQQRDHEATRCVGTVDARLGMARQQPESRCSR